MVFWKTKPNAWVSHRRIPVPEQGREGADHQDHRQHPEAQKKETGRVGDRVRLTIRAGEEAENELHPRLGAGGEPVHRRPRGGQDDTGGWNAEEDQHQGELGQGGADGEAPGKAGAVFGKGPADGQDHGDP